MKKRSGWSRHENAAVLADALMDKGFEVEVTRYDVTDALRVRVPGRKKWKGLIAVYDDGRIQVIIGNTRPAEFPDEPTIREVLIGLGLSEFLESVRSATEQLVSMMQKTKTVGQPRGRS